MLKARRQLPRRRGFVERIVEQIDLDPFKTSDGSRRLDDAL
jgi:hypothetical protein